MELPDNWCQVARIYDQYALFGNAVLPACVTWVCERIGDKSTAMFYLMLPTAWLPHG